MKRGSKWANLTYLLYPWKEHALYRSMLDKGKREGSNDEYGNCRSTRSDELEQNQTFQVGNTGSGAKAG